MLTSKNEIIDLQRTDSTNNYAMSLINGNKAHHGTTIYALTQTAGKGQRGKKWVDLPGQSLIMSLIAQPNWNLDQQFLWNATIAISIAEYLMNLHEGWKVNIKWTNDIIINDKKAGGILIENVLRGSNWLYSVVGFGLNILQDHFPEDLPVATSLKIASNIDFDLSILKKEIRERLLEAISFPKTEEVIIFKYNKYLYKINQSQKFRNTDGVFEGVIHQVYPNGSLALILDGGITKHFHYGELIWEW